LDKICPEISIKIELKFIKNMHEQLFLEIKWKKLYLLGHFSPAVPAAQSIRRALRIVVAQLAH
jgi:hypothetical protein